MAFLCSVNSSFKIILQEVFLPKANFFLLLSSCAFCFYPWKGTIGMNTKILCLSLSI